MVWVVPSTYIGKPLGSTSWASTLMTTLWPSVVDDGASVVVALTGLVIGAAALRLMWPSEIALPPGNHQVLTSGTLSAIWIGIPVLKTSPVARSEKYSSRITI